MFSRGRTLNVILELNYKFVHKIGNNFICATSELFFVNTNTYLLQTLHHLSKLQNIPAVKKKNNLLTTKKNHIFRLDLV